MGKLTVTLTEETKQAFREHVKTVYEDKKGALSIAVEKIILKWLNRSALVCPENGVKWS